jgi:hypothetical protein
MLLRCIGGRGAEDDFAGMQKVNAIAALEALVMLCTLKTTGSVPPVPVGAQLEANFPPIARTIPPYSFLSMRIIGGVDDSRAFSLLHLDA